MKALVSAVVVVLSVTQGAYAQQAVQWRTQDSGNGHWYQIRRTSVGLTWAAASQMATSDGGYLATIANSQENAFVFSLIGPTSSWPTRNGPWLGGLYDGAAWRWGTAEPWTYSNWYPGEPNYVCEAPFRLQYVEYSPRWNDSPISGICNDGTGGAWSYAVEWSADCNGDGIIDYSQCRDGSLPDYNLNNIPDCCEAGSVCTVGRYPVQWRVEDGGNGHWYVFNSTFQPWDVAQAAAVAQGGHLACIATAEENNFVRARLPSGQSAIGYLGAFRDASGWRWVSGEPWSFTNWNPGEPNGSAGEVAWIANIPGYPNGWNDHPTSFNIQASIIEWSADCNNDGIVDFGQIRSGLLPDTNGDGVPNVCQCPGDVSGNYIVDGVDLAAVLGAWGTSGQGQLTTDITGDGVVDGQDLAVILAGWGPCPQ